ncbi:MAG TPA: hypothetical protein PK239_14140 [Chitinophagales bacterium]|nr:hypothetical protein [Chitinophagales bacterium]
MINRLFLFAIGGTGSRVLKALVMLLAGGTPINAQEIVVIIIDPDIQNGNLTDTEQLLKHYRTINKNCIGNTVSGDCFFRPKISTLYDIDGGTTITRDSFTYDFGAGINTNFDAFINYNTMNSQDQMFMNVLFSQNNLRSNLSIGFKGHPNVGTIVLNTFNNSAEFACFKNVFSNTTDRVFVISSIFGGTGAAGFPLLVQLMRTDPNHNVNKAPIGALSVGPYFNIAKPPTDGKIDGQQAIDPTIFVTKMKAALSYYQNNLNNLDAIYYLSDTVLSNPQDPSLGGQTQANDAHFIELLGASSIIHFCALASGVLPSAGGTGANPQAYEHFLQDADANINLKKLGRVSANEVIGKPLVKLKYLSRLLLKYNNIRINNNKTSISGESDGHLESNSLRQAWAINIGYNSTYLGSATYQSIKYVLREYLKWLYEMQQNQRQFNPFNLDSNAEIKNIISGKPIKDGLVSNFDKDTFDRAYGRVYNSKAISNLTGTDKKFLSLMWIGISKVYDEWVKTIK